MASFKDNEREAYVFKDNMNYVPFLIKWQFDYLSLMPLIFLPFQ